ncbi:MAG: hypothetical protein IBJ09_13615 [Bacteroidia bacterium]|nr:hypothetical protein [Bacteroidia bacterium]
MEKKRSSSAGFYILLLLFTGIGGLIIHGYNGEKRYYSGGDLVEKELVLDEALSYKSSSRTESGFYSLHARGYACRFRIEKGAFDLVQNSGTNAWLRVDSLSAGDTLRVKFGRSDEKKLRDARAHIPLVQVETGGEVLLSAAELQQYNSKERRFHVRVAFGLVILAALVWAFRYYGRRLDRAGGGSTQSKI